MRATILPLAIALTKAFRATVSAIAKGSIVQCSKLMLVRQAMADNSSSGLTIFEKITL